MERSKRDDFPPKEKLALAKRAGWLCSFPGCRQPTVGASSDGESDIMTGVAAHICAASPGGPRYEAAQTPQQRSSTKENGIWMCQNHARAIDSKDPMFTAELLRQWKQEAERESYQRVIANDVAYVPPTCQPPDAKLKLINAAKADLLVFQRMTQWPSTAVELTLHVPSLHLSLTSSELARIASTLDDLVIIAAPGMGKSSTIFQIAEHLLLAEIGTPLIVRLGDWATQGTTILNSILLRPSFRGVSEIGFYEATADPGVVLMLDGWNELDLSSRERAMVEIATLKAQTPELGLIVTTRRQSLDVPIDGLQVDILPLGEVQQMEIAVLLRGESGKRILNLSWSIPGLRDLVSIPLYLTRLLALPEDSPFPTTKEEVLRSFVDTHEREPRNAHALAISLQSLQHDYLVGLATTATYAFNTTIDAMSARRAISQASALLFDDGQISTKPQPETVLNTLVSNHILLRPANFAGYSFQHQQFQEWYASHYVENLMKEALTSAESQERLKADVMNYRPWTEAILFAVERASRPPANQQAACSAAILYAFEIDPMLAAEMIYRASNGVWLLIAETILSRVRSWHSPDSIDRAVTFMICTGREDFSSFIWPLVESENQQIYIGAIRSANVFRPSVLGADAASRISRLTFERRGHVLCEIASHGDAAGLDLVLAILKGDANAEVKSSVIEALWFRGAEHHFSEALLSADDLTFDALAKKANVETVANEILQERIDAAMARRAALPQSPLNQINELLRKPLNGDVESQIENFLAKLGSIHEGVRAIPLLGEMFDHAPRAFAKGLLRRVREGRDLVQDSPRILSEFFSLDDDDLVSIALQESGRFNGRADAASSVLAPMSVGKLIDAYLAAATKMRNSDGTYNEFETERFHTLRGRIVHVLPSSLVAAVQTRAEACSVEEIPYLAELFSKDIGSLDNRKSSYSSDARAAIGELAKKWGARLLNSGNVNRMHKASIATLISCVPSNDLLATLQRLLDDNIARYGRFRELAAESNWRDRAVVTEAQNPHMHEFQRAFVAIPSRDSTQILSSYLTNEHFGSLAAETLAIYWSVINEPSDDGKFIPREIDFSRVSARRAKRILNPSATCEAAELIFTAVESLLAEDATDSEKQLACSLSVIGARLPHGTRPGMFTQIIQISPRQTRAALLLSLILSGEDIEFELIEAGIAETFEAAKEAAWILQDDNPYQLRDWLRLMPFATEISKIPATIRALPERLRTPRILDELILLLGSTPSSNAEEVLFALAEDDHRIYCYDSWRTAVLNLGTLTSAAKLVDRTLDETLRKSRKNDLDWRNDLASLIARHTEIRARVRGLLKTGMTTQPQILLAKALSEVADAEDVALLVRLEKMYRLQLLSWRSIENAITQRIPSELSHGAYNLVPVDVRRLRQELLSQIDANDPHDHAARCLTAIDKLRDHYGHPETEPRHPDIASGRQWPIMALDPDAERAE